MAFQSTSSNPTTAPIPRLTHSAHIAPTIKAFPTSTFSPTRSTNGIPKNFSVIASKSFLLSGELDFNILDMSVDTGDNTPLDQGTRSMRFTSAASSLLEHFTPSPSAAIHLPKHHRKSAAPVLEPLSGGEHHSSETDGAKHITEASFAALETEPMTPPSRIRTHPAPHSFFLPRTDLTFSSSGHPENTRNWALASASSTRTSGAHRYVPHHDDEGNKPTTGLSLASTPRDRSSHIDGKVAPRDITTPYYSIDEIQPNPIPAATPSRNTCPHIDTVTAPDVALSPRNDVPQSQCHSSTNKHGKRKSKRSNIRGIQIFKRFTSRGWDEAVNPGQAPSNSSLLQRLSVVKRRLSPRNKKTRESTTGSPDRRGEREPASRTGNGRGSKLSPMPLLNEISSQSGPAINGGERRSQGGEERAEENQSPVGPTTCEQDTGDCVGGENKPRDRLQAVKSLVMKFLYRFVD